MRFLIILLSFAAYGPIACGEDGATHDDWPGRAAYSHLDAYDPVTGKKQWTYQYKFVLLASVLATAGDLVFSGDPEGFFFALTRAAERSFGASKLATAITDPR